MTDLFQDVNDGTNLLNLLEIIGKDTIQSICGRKFYPSAKCKMDIHKLENNNLVIDYLKKKELKVSERSERVLTRFILCRVIKIFLLN